MIREIHASLQRRLVAKPSCSDLLGVKGREWLSALELSAEEREPVDAAMRHIEFLDREIAQVEKNERLRARKGPGKAIVATARKLAVLFWCMLTRGDLPAQDDPGKSG